MKVIYKIKTMIKMGGIVQNSRDRVSEVIQTMEKTELTKPQEDCHIRR
jgi:hypothetical protein